MNFALASGLLSILFLRITQRRLISILLGLFFALSGGGLTHSLGSEDIAGAIPAIVIIFIFVSRGPISSFTKGRLFALSLSLAYVHLWEWRAALPIYLALFVLLLSEKPWRNVQKHLKIWVRIVLVWIFALAVTYLLVSLVFRLPGFDLGVFERYPLIQIIGDSLLLGNYPVSLYLLGFAAIIFSGKGVGTMWGGFTEDKFSFQVIGLIETLFGGRNISYLWPDYPLWVLFLAAVFYLVAVYGAVISLRSGEWKQLGLMLVAFSLGSALFNLYSQPQDPQMQVTALPSTLTLIAVALSRLRYRRLAESLVGSYALLLVLLIMSLVASVLNFQGNLKSFLETSGSDAAAAEIADEIVHLANKKGSVLFGTGREGEVTWVAFKSAGLNRLGETAYDRELTNVFLAVDFVRQNPKGDPRDWLCASWKAFTTLPPDLELLSLLRDRQDSRWSFRTILSERESGAYQKLRKKAFTVGDDGIVTPDQEFLSGTCE